MSFIEDVRVERLRALIKESSLAEVSRRAQRAPAQLSGMANKKRPFGERAARSLEDNMGLPMGWFDRPNDKPDDQAEDQPLTKGVSYLSAEAADLFPVSTIVLQGGESTMNDVTVYLDGDVFRRYFPSQSREDFRAAIVTDTSMCPTLNPTDRVLIDVSKPRFTTTGIYCLDTPAGKILRKLSCNLDGTHSVCADSAPDERQLLENFKDVSIVGRVEMVWHAQKL